MHLKIDDIAALGGAAWGWAHGIAGLWDWRAGIVVLLLVWLLKRDASSFEIGWRGVRWRGRRR